MNKNSTSLENQSNKLWQYLSVLNLFFCCIFTILGIISVGFLHSNNYRLYGELYEYGGTGEGSVYFNLGFFLPLILSFFVCIISSIIACLCLAKNRKPKINISTLLITAFLFLFCAISFLIYIIQ